MEDSQRPSLLHRLLRLARPEPGAPPARAGRPKTVSVPVHRLPERVLLPRDVLDVPAIPEGVSAEGWVAVLEEAAFQAAQRPAALPVLCTLAQFARSGSGVALRGMARAWVHGLTPSGAGFLADVATAEAPSVDAAVVEPLAAELRALGRQLLRARPAGPFYLSVGTVDAMREPEGLADLFAAWCDPGLDARRSILAAVALDARLRAVLDVVRQRLSAPRPGGSGP
ncbi:hypothetical protein P2318_16510 [Myxococcaceae bacterium GXIMD 01537]